MNGPSEFFVTISVPSGQPEDLRVIKRGVCIIID